MPPQCLMVRSQQCSRSGASASLDKPRRRPPRGAPRPPGRPAADATAVPNASLDKPRRRPPRGAPRPPGRPAADATAVPNASLDKPRRRPPRGAPRPPGHSAADATAVPNASLDKPRSGDHGDAGGNAACPRPDPVEVPEVTGQIALRHLPRQEALGRLGLESSAERLRRCGTHQWQARPPSSAPVRHGYRSGPVGPLWNSHTWADPTGGRGCATTRPQAAAIGPCTPRCPARPRHSRPGQARRRRRAGRWSARGSATRRRSRPRCRRYHPSSWRKPPGVWSSSAPFTGQDAPGRSGGTGTKTHDGSDHRCPLPPLSPFRATAADRRHPQGTLKKTVPTDLAEPHPFNRSVDLRRPECQKSDLVEVGSGPRGPVEPQGVDMSVLLLLAGNDPCADHRTTEPDISGADFVR